MHDKNAVKLHTHLVSSRFQQAPIYMHMYKLYIIYIILYTFAYRQTDGHTRKVAKGHKDSVKCSMSCSQCTPVHTGCDETNGQKGGVLRRSGTEVVLCRVVVKQASAQNPDTAANTSK